MVSELNKKLFPISIFFISIAIASLINLNNEITSGTFVGRLIGFIGYFNYYDMSFLDISIYPKEVIDYGLFSIGNGLKGITLILFIISEFTNIAPKHIILFPFGIFLSMIAYYTLCKSLFNAYNVSIFILVFSALLSFASSDLLGGYASAWTIILFLLSLLVFVKGISEVKSNRYILILVILYFATFLYWHTVEANIILLLISYNSILIFLLILRKIMGENQNFKFKLLLLPLLVCLINSIAFKEFLIKKNGYISNINFDTLYQVYTFWFQKILSQIGLIDLSDKIIKNQYVYVPYSNWIQISSISGLIFILLILLPIILSCILDLKRLFSHNLSWINKFSFLKWSLLMIQFIKTILYGIAGGAGPGLIISFFPIISIISLYELVKDINLLKRIGNKKIVGIYLLIIIILTFTYLSYAISNNIEETKHTRYSELSPTSDFYLKLDFRGQDVQKTLTDFMLAGKMLTLLGENGHVFKYKCINPHMLDNIISNNKPYSADDDIDYFLININEIQSPLYMDQGWEKIIPLNDKIKIIESRNSKIRLDGTTAIYLM